MNENITINLFGKSYNFKTDDGVSDAKAVADFLEKEVNGLGSAGSPSAMGNDVALLTQAALNIANGFIELKHKHSDILNRLSNRTEALKQKLDDCLCE